MKRYKEHQFATTSVPLIDAFVDALHYDGNNSGAVEALQTSVKVLQNVAMRLFAELPEASQARVLSGIVYGVIVDEEVVDPRDAKLEAFKGVMSVPRSLGEIADAGYLLIFEHYSPITWQYKDGKYSLKVAR